MKTTNFLVWLKSKEGLKAITSRTKLVEDTHSIRLSIEAAIALARIEFLTKEL